MKQSEFDLTNSGPSQCALILERLQATPGEWVAMPVLHQVSGSMNVHSRVSDLRKQGHSILHKNEKEGRTIKSFYQLLTH